MCANEISGSLQLAIQARAFENYFYLQGENENHPERYVGNSLVGRLCENGVEYLSTLFSFTSYLPFHLLASLPFVMYLAYFC